MKDKQRKVLKIIVIILIVFLIVEIGYFGFKYYSNRQNSTYYTIVNSAIIADDDNYIGAGFSDFKNSDIHKYNNGINKATIFLKKNGKITEEIVFKKGYNSYFNDIVKTNDGYIVVGSVQITKEQQKEKLSEGLIIKYDKKFNIIWRKNIGILGKSELFKVKVDKNGDIVAVGTSVYGEGYVGNHKTGGGIILKYNKDGKELFRANNGGPYNGKFNDILIEDDGYVAVGVGKSNSGIIIKYSKSGKKMWSNYYGYTDVDGINSIVKLKNNYITATTKVINPKDLSNYSAAIVKFDNKGKKIDDVKYSNSNINYFKDIILDKNDNIIVCGYTGKKQKNILNTDALIVKYDKDLYEITSNVLKGNKNDFYNQITLGKNNFLVMGYSNSDLKEFKTNGYDYFPIIKNYNSNLK